MASRCTVHTKWQMKTWNSVISPRIEFLELVWSLFTGAVRGLSPGQLGVQDSGTHVFCHGFSYSGLYSMDSRIPACIPYSKLQVR